MQLPNSGGEKKFLPPAKIDGERDRMSNFAFSLILYPGGYIGKLKVSYEKSI